MGNADSAPLPPVPGLRSLEKRSMAGALSGPAKRRYLHLHSTAAVTAVAGRLQFQLFPASKVRIRRGAGGAVVGLSTVAAEAAAAIWIFGTRASRYS
ncbi:hypothetical protein [Arthrobacter sp.]|uniref:hypothetical protein n=1 Tax=Arthrobacter sp. TaxID=1667 RepID=UPI0028116AD6|nr:hypothetical protein [Arthrobacter sp.]